MGTLGGTLDGDFERNFKRYSEWDPEGKFKGGLLLIFFGGLWGALWRGIQGGLWSEILMGLCWGIYWGLWWGIWLEFERDSDGEFNGYFDEEAFKLPFTSILCFERDRQICWFLLNTQCPKKTEKTLGLLTQLLIGLPTSAAHCPTGLSYSLAYWPQLLIGFLASAAQLQQNITKTILCSPDPLQRSTEELDLTHSPSRCWPVFLCCAGRRGHSKYTLFLREGFKNKNKK